MNKNIKEKLYKHRKTYRELTGHNISVDWLQHLVNSILVDQKNLESLVEESYREGYKDGRAAHFRIYVDDLKQENVCWANSKASIKLKNFQET